MLDIHGITNPEQSLDGGLGVLAHIKRYNPSQVVIAYSAKKYDFKQADFWRLADDYLGKPSPLLTCKQKIDDLLRNRFSVQYYWEALLDVLRRNDCPEGTIRKIEKLIIKTQGRHRKTVSAEEIMEVLKLSREVASIASVIITVILRLSSTA